MLTDGLFTQAEAKEIYEFATGERSYFFDGGQGLSDSAQFKLYCAFQPEMPYGVQKARTGDPDQWMGERLCSMGDEAAIAWISERTEGGFNL